MSFVAAYNKEIIICTIKNPQYICVFHKFVSHLVLTSKPPPVGTKSMYPLLAVYIMCSQFGLQTLMTITSTLRNPSQYIRQGGSYYIWHKLVVQCPPGVGTEYTWLCVDNTLGQALRIINKIPHVSSTHTW